MEAWTKEELVAAIAESDKRKDEYMRKIDQEVHHQQSLYELLSKVLVKNPLPRFDE